MLIQKFLETHSLSDLEAVGIDYNLFDNGHIIQLNYNQITAQESDPMARECRALILYTYPAITETDIVGMTNVVSRSFDRFFNIGQQNTSIDFSKNITIFEKLDGSLINIFNYKGVWKTSTRSVWNGENTINNTVSFNSLVIKSLEEMGTSFEELTSKLDSRFNYSFELLTPLNIVVVSHNNFSLRLIGCREIQSGLEKDIRSIDIGIPIPKIYDFNSVEDIIIFIEALEDHNFEGFVALTQDNGVFHRVKIKSPKYLIAHRVATLATCNHHLMDMILQNIDDDMIQYLSDYFKEKLFDIKIKFNEYLVRSDKLFHEYKALDRKEFALVILEHKDILAQHLFNMYTNKARSTLESVQKQKKDGAFPRSVLDSILGIIGLIGDKNV
jgi:hypothetical protein